MTFTKLYVGYNKPEDFRILVRALDKEEAAELAAEYQEEAGLDGEFSIAEFHGRIDALRFDCDYVIASQERMVQGHELEYVDDLLEVSDVDYE